MRGASATSCGHGSHLSAVRSLGSLQLQAELLRFGCVPTWKRSTMADYSATFHNCSSSQRAA
eukprot:7581728-Pyramimonas_sp.AAC.1